MESEFGSGLVPRPLKPPRGNKTPSGGLSSSKETGILMRVIKTLSVAASTDHRDRERAKLEKDFKKSDAQLDALLATRQPSLSSVMQVGYLSYLIKLCLINSCPYLAAIFSSLRRSWECQGEGAVG